MSDSNASSDVASKHCAGTSPVGDAPFTYGWTFAFTYDNYALEQFDKTIRLFKLMENVHLLGHPQIAPLASDGTHKLCLVIANFV